MTEQTDNKRKVFGRNVAAERHRRDWSQEKLADEAGISRVYVSRVERGTASPSIMTADRLADALDVKLSTLMGEE